MAEVGAPGAVLATEEPTAGAAFGAFGAFGALGVALAVGDPTAAAFGGVARAVGDPTAAFGVVGVALAPEDSTAGAAVDAADVDAAVVAFDAGGVALAASAAKGVAEGAATLGVLAALSAPCGEALDDDGEDSEAADGVVGASGRASAEGTFDAGVAGVSAVGVDADVEVDGAADDAAAPIAARFASTY